MIYICFDMIRAIYTICTQVKKYVMYVMKCKNTTATRLASGRGARVSACAGLINQQRCRFDSRIACLENPDTAIVGA